MISRSLGVLYETYICRHGSVSYPSTTNENWQPMSRYMAVGLLHIPLGVAILSFKGSSKIPVKMTYDLHLSSSACFSVAHLCLYVSATESCAVSNCSVLYILIFEPYLKDNLGSTDKAEFSLLRYRKRRLFPNRTHVQRYCHPGFYTLSWYIRISLFSQPTNRLRDS